MKVETDPKKIRERMERDGQLRRNQPHTTYVEAAKQILWLSWKAGRIIEAEYQSKLAEAIAFDEKQRAEANSNKNSPTKA